MCVDAEDQLQVKVSYILYKIISQTQSAVQTNIGLLYLHLVIYNNKAHTAIIWRVSVYQLYLFIEGVSSNRL